MDMHSGGGCKEPPYERIYIEAPESDARVIFYNRFGHNPERVTCTCCGDDYSIDSEEVFEKVAAYDMGWDFDDKAGEYVNRPSSKACNPHGYCSVDEYKAKDHVLVIPVSEIKPEERKGEVPDQGFMWVD